MNWNSKHYFDLRGWQTCKGRYSYSIYLGSFIFIRSFFCITGKQNNACHFPLSVIFSMIYCWKPQIKHHTLNYIGKTTFPTEWLSCSLDLPRVQKLMYQLFWPRIWELKDSIKMIWTIILGKGSREGSAVQSIKWNFRDFVDRVTKYFQQERKYTLFFFYLMLWFQLRTSFSSSLLIILELWFTLETKESEITIKGEKAHPCTPEN